MTIRFEKKNYITTLTEKQQKTSAWSSGKIDKYEYLTGEEILPSNQRQLIEQAKFLYFPLEIAFEEQTRRIWSNLKKKTKIIWNFKKFKTRKIFKSCKSRRKSRTRIN